MKISYAISDYKLTHAIEDKIESHLTMDMDSAFIDWDVKDDTLIINASIDGMAGNDEEGYLTIQFEGIFEYRAEELAPLTIKEATAKICRDIAIECERFIEGEWERLDKEEDDPDRFRDD